MTFLRQKKETKRKISFLMALALIVSLLPVSPVAKAAGGTKTNKVSISVSQEILSSNIVLENDEISLTNGDNTASGASITLKAKDGYTLKEKSGEPLSANVQATTTSGSACATLKNGSPSFSSGVVTIEILTSPTTTAIKVTELKGVEAKSNTSASPSVSPSVSPNASPSVSPTPIATPAPTAPPVAAEGDIAEGIKNDLFATTTAKPYVAEIKDDTLKADIDNQVKVEEFTNITEEEKTELTQKLENEEAVKTVQTVFDTVEEKDKTAAEEVVNNIAESSLKVKDVNSSSDIKDTFTKDELKEIMKESKKTKNEGRKAVTLNIKAFAAIAEKESGKVLATGGAITELKSDLEIVFPRPDEFAKLADKEENGDKLQLQFFVLRFHEGGSVDILPCIILEDGSLLLKSNKFSTYVLFYEYVKVGSGSNKPAGGSSLGGGSSVSYVSPGTSTTPDASAAPSASAAPAASGTPATSGAPEASTAPDASGAPGTSAAPGTGTPETSAAPSASGTPDASAAPVATLTPDKDSTVSDKEPGTTTPVKAGYKATVKNINYKVTSVKGTKTVQFTGAKKNVKKVVIPATVKVKGKSYKVTTIANGALKGNKKVTNVTIGKNINKIGKNAFKGCKNLKNIVIKTNKLTAKRIGKDAFKNIKKNAKIKVPGKKAKVYRKAIKAKGGAGKNVKVVK